ncbi:MAG: Mur ligase domain-containing protein, partial [Bacteroidota bacterium]
MKLDKVSNIYFLGIGGIGMSALARYFMANKKNIAGFDRTATPLTHQLTEEGAFIHYEDNPNLIPDVFLLNQNTLVIYTPA